jgi:integral membrane protein
MAIIATCHPSIAKIFLIQIIAMIHLFKSPIGRLRIIGFLEGISLILLVFIAVPLKYFFNYPALVKMLGPIHGLLFCLFVFITLSVGVSYKWSFAKTTWKVLLACVVPFGTFYIDKHILLPQSICSAHTKPNLIAK